MRHAWAGVVVFVLGFQMISMAFGGELPPSRWEEIRGAMGQMNLDGTLRKRLSVSEPAELKPLGFRLALEHEVATDAWGEAMSVWRVRGLLTFLAPVDRQWLLWQPLAGTPLRFDREKIGPALSGAGQSRWNIRSLGEDRYEIRSLEGVAWLYDHGCLKRVTHPAAGTFSASTRGAWITTLARIETPAQPLLVATYAEDGFLSGCQVGSGAPQHFESNELGQLQRWQRTDGSEVICRYADKLMVELHETGKPAEKFTWEKNPGYGRGDMRWMAPVHLASDNDDVYAYDMTRRGFAMKRHAISTSTDVVTVLNPARYRLEQQQANRTFIVSFRPEAASRGGIRQIVSGRGEVLEDYIYDAAGQLVGIRRKDEPMHRLTYDELGRIAIVE